jgi:hypothetical protein
MFAMLFHHGLSFISFIVAEVVCLERFFDSINADPDLIRVVRCAILPQQVLEHI